MQKCSNCKADCNDGLVFCPNCGYSLPESITPAPKPSREEPKPTKPQRSSKKPTQKAAQTVNSDNVPKKPISIPGILAYFDLFVIIPMLGHKKSDFLRFHANQGIGLLIMDAAFTIISLLLTDRFLTQGVKEYHDAVYEPGHVGSTFIPWFVWVIITVLVLISVLYKYLGVRSVVNNDQKRLFPISAFNGLQPDKTDATSNDD